jgi:hypothetical protein
MIIKLNTDGTITIEPRPIPEPLDRVYISYVLPKGFNHLRPVLDWGGVLYEGQDVYISKSPTKFNMKVTLYNGEEVHKVYKTKATPQLYIGYDINCIRRDLLCCLERLERENQELKERGDII